MKYTKRIITFVLVALMLVPAIALIPGSATVLRTQTATLPTTTVDNPIFSFHPTDSSPDAHPFRESEITYKDTSLITRTFYFATQNPAYSSALTENVSFEGDTYTCAVIYLLNGEFSGTGVFAKANSTIFIDGGTYTDTNPANYTDLSAENLALVGLTDPYDTNATPVVFKKASDGTGIERNLVNNGGMLYYNLIFDADGNRMRNDSSRGYHYIHIPQGNRDFYLKRCILQNNASGGLGTNPNRAINVLGGYGADPAQSLNTGHINIEDVTVRNWIVNASYAVLSLNQSANLNLRNINVSVNATPSAGVIRIEHPTGPSTTSIYGKDLQNVNVVFDGTLNITNSGTNAVIEPTLVLQSNAYGNVTLPSDDFKFAEFRGNGTATGTAETYGRVSVYKTLPAAAANNVIFDLRDNSWIVRQGATPATAPTVSSQLSYINIALQRMAQPLSTGATDASQGYNGRALRSQAYIKILADGDGYLPVFTAPSFATTFSDGAVPNVHIRAVQSVNTLFGSALTSVADMVPVRAVSSTAVAPPFILTAPNSGNVRLYGIDFHGAAGTGTHYTLQETLSGRTADLDTSAGSTDPVQPVFQNATSDSFVFCRFTGLVDTLKVIEDTQDGTPPTQAGSALPKVSGNYIATKIDGNITAEADSTWFTAPNAGLFAQTPTALLFADDTDYVWSSSAPGVATVNTSTGVITPVGFGTVIITVTAADAFNEGEIVKPSAFITLEIRPTVTFMTNFGNNAVFNRQTVPYTNTASAPNTNPANVGFVFTGWYTDPAATVPYNFSTAVTDDIVLYAGWSQGVYTLKYDGNGADSGTVAPNAPENLNAYTTVKGNGFVKKGYTFTGWNTKADGSGTAVAAGKADFTSAVEGDVFLYAQWAENPKYTLKYSGNGAESGSVAANAPEYINEFTTVKGNGFIKAGYTFTGWNTKADGSGTAVAAGKADFTSAVAGDVFLHAQWKKTTGGSPNTGDSNTIALWSCIGGGSVLAALTLGITGKLRKKRNEE
ncbi:MAG: InlB B-repeat-containing protein [Oscillospiraceae bacterium]|nr:InlB B-repeat-containing protein [Oscillospiraceae bacterium]